MKKGGEESDQQLKNYDLLRSTGEKRQSEKQSAWFLISFRQDAEGAYVKCI